MLKVELIAHTPDPIRAVATAARLCYSSVGIAELRERMKPSAVQALIAKVLDAGHFSCLEHASFSFGIEGISRACSHQLVRHRVASYSQQSQRYVKEVGQFKYRIPDSIRGESRKRFEGLMAIIAHEYERLVEEGVPAEDARFVLPNAAETKLVVTMNARELHHFFSLRCCSRAQWEIRALAKEMLRLAHAEAPLLFETAGAGCVRGACPEGEMGCGRPQMVISTKIG